MQTSQTGATGGPDEDRSLQLQEERQPIRRSLSSSARLCRQYSQENRDDIQLTIKSDSFESPLAKGGPGKSKSSSKSQRSDVARRTDLGDDKKELLAGIDGLTRDAENDRVRHSREAMETKAPQNSFEESIKSHDSSKSHETDSLNSPVIKHKRINSAQRRKEFASSVRRAKQIANQEVEGSIHSSGSLCKSCCSWCSAASYQSESYRDSITSCPSCSPRLLSSKESGFSRSMDYESLEYSRSRKCSRCSLESDETGLGGMDFMSSRNSETMSMGSHRHHHHRRHRTHNAPRHHHHKHRHRRRRSESNSQHQHHGSPHNSIGGHSHR